MEGKNPLWNTFKKSGKVEDYLRFSRDRKEKFTPR